MAYIPGSSFIPKDGMNATPKVAQRKRAFHVMGFVASTLLVLSVLAAVGVVGYKAYLSKQLEIVQGDLDRARKEEGDVSGKLKEIAILDRQLKTAVQLLENHMAPSRIFAELEKMTKATVGFTEFEYKYSPGNFAELTLTGGTNQLTSVALQKIEFAAQSLFTSFTIEDVTLDLDVPGGDDEVEEGPKQDPVGFTIEGTLNTDAIKYTGEMPALPVTLFETTPELVETQELAGEVLQEEDTQL